MASPTQLLLFAPDALDEPDYPALPDPAPPPPGRSYAGPPLPRVAIHQRRYLGNKQRMLEWIAETLHAECGPIEGFCDLFAGSGVVAHRFLQDGIPVVANDLLTSNVVCLEAWLSSAPFRPAHVEACLAELATLRGGSNYVARTFGGRYFSPANARKIGAIRARIERLELLPRERAILLAALLYAMDRVANTVGHYDAYRETLDTLQALELRLPDAGLNDDLAHEVLQRDANELVRERSFDLLYLDPPYNSRQYADAYHVLENVARWERPPVFGKTRKFDRSGLKSRYNGRQATEALEDLVAHARCRFLALSYSNMAGSGHSRSNARIADDAILRILGSRGEVQVFEQEHKPFSARKSRRTGHRERLFLLRVRA